MSRFIKSTVNDDTLVISPQEDGLTAVSILDAAGFIQSSIIVQTEELVPANYSFDAFSFPTEAGSLFSAYDPEDEDRYTYETYANKDGDAVYKLDGGEFYTSEELWNSRDFRMESE